LLNEKVSRSKMTGYRFNYFITIHNKEKLIANVIYGILNNCHGNPHIYPILDGCTDFTESIIDGIMAETEVPIHKVYAPDVHEILSINIGLKEAPQEGAGFNIILQDDVVLIDDDLEINIITIYEHYGYYNIGVLAFRHGVDIELNHEIKEIEEKNLVENIYGSGISKHILLPGQILSKTVGVRSPECLSFHVVTKIGMMDEILAPYTYDNHDYSLRCLKNGLKNYLYSLKFKSDSEWGGMRQNPHPEVKNIMKRNRRYLYEKHKYFIESKDYIIERELYQRSVKVRDLGKIKIARMDKLLEDIVHSLMKGRFLILRGVRMIMKRVLNKFNSRMYI